MAENLESLSPEDQAALAQLMRQRQFAQLLQQRSMQNSPTEMVSGHAIKQSPLGVLVRGASGYFGSKMQDTADTQQAQIMGRGADRQQQELTELLADPKKGMARALASKITAVRNAAAALQKQEADKLAKWADLAKGVNAPQAANQFAAGEIAPVGDYRQPEVRTVPNANGGPGMPAMVNFGEGGRPTATLPPAAPVTNINTRQEGREGEMAIDVLKTDLTNRRTKADSAKEALASTTFAVDALEQGAKAGGGEPTKQILRKALQAVGMEVDATAEVDQLEMALGSAVLAQIAKLRPASDTDFKALQKIMGSVGTDPKALVKGLAYANSIAIRDLDQFGNYVNEQKANISNPNARDMFSGAGSGYELPGQLTGPLPFQLETLRQIQRQGGDISRFRDPAGNPFPANTKFDIDPTKGFPGIQRPAKPVSGMSQAEKDAEAAAIRARLGIAK